MDLYFKAAAIMAFGALFCILAYYVSLEIGIADYIFNQLRKPPENYALDVRAAKEEFYVDLKSFVPFVVGQQSQHTVILMDDVAPKWYTQLTPLLVLVEFDVQIQATLAGEMRTIPIVISTEFEYDSRAASGEPSFASRYNAVDVTGDAGSYLEDIKSFALRHKNNDPIRVRRFTSDEGKIVLVCDGGS